MRVIAIEKLVFELAKSVILDRGADLVGEVNDKMFVMNTGENFGSDFVGLEEMVEIGSVVIFTTFAITFRHDGREVVAKPGIADVDAAVESIESAIAS